jgi:hypothetical protein
MGHHQVNDWLHIGGGCGIKSKSKVKRQKYNTEYGRQETGDRISTFGGAGGCGQGDMEAAELRTAIKELSARVEQIRDWL